MKPKMPSQKARAYLYRVLIAAGAVVAFYGFMSANEVAMWAGLGAVVLNVMPTANTSTMSGGGSEDSAP
ncbi:phage holin [Glaciibacter psychrotolerans]|uniref:Uncharacterized protein n=1 Tax=Glaciibacter psychrotolerans TaxID=670054 RepID=A0A7Z0EFP4_9MICO|nr:hypothetical protein [Leifsonia psychrotolerans]NYJ20801.1 hypothetical protein [Leifsonia psychrotolerans]